MACNCGPFFMRYIKIELPVINEQQSELLVAELAEIDFDAFEENTGSLAAFIKEEKFNVDELDKIIQPKNISYTKTVIEHTNWNAKWESEFEPVIIDNYVAIRAAFHKPVPGVKYDIIITPKMSFGTGHHATTSLMLQQMEKMDLNGLSVLDFGTGTGILAIMANKLGAEKVVAIDNDELSIQNAQENFGANNCAGIELYKRDFPGGIGLFDVVMANINFNTITENIYQLVATTTAGSKLLLSGFLTTDEKTLTGYLLSAGFIHLNTTKKDEWISMLLTKS